MPDITLCENKNCPLRLSCKRFMTKPQEDKKYQSYAIFEPFTHKGKVECHFFIEYKGF